NERFAIDPGGRTTLYLASWNEVKFVDGVIMGAIQRLTPLPLRRQMLLEILRRTDRIAPLAANQLKAPGVARVPRPAPSRSDCINALREAPCAWPSRTPF